MRRLLTTRLLFLWVFVLCSVAMGIALYFQFVRYLMPCMLCVSQRVVIIVLGVVALVACVHGPGAKGTRVYGALSFLCSLLGCWFAGRQVWLQHLQPGQMPACGPGFDFLLQSLPPKDLLVLLFKGTGDCAVVHWTGLGLTIPEWSLLLFLLILLVGVWQMFRRN